MTESEVFMSARARMYCLSFDATISTSCGTSPPCALGAAGRAATGAVDIPACAGLAASLDGVSAAGG